MKQFLFIILSLFILVSIVNAQEQFFEIKSSEGKTLQLPVTDAGPVPFENEIAKIEMAGFGITLQDNKFLLYWIFGLKSKIDTKLNSVRVFDVTPGSGTILLVGDDSPNLVKNYWKKSLTPNEINKDNFPWLFEKGTTIKLFKFTLQFKDKEIELYQLAWYSQQVKEKLLYHIDVR
ncbi:MAG: hypothetical protein KKF54_05655 [Candidatus Omnitrophica bacterium]|nr:hypothetical protein [Candidatus Omnitrophota bacterium]